MLNDNLKIRKGFWPDYILPKMGIKKNQTWYCLLNFGKRSIPVIFIFLFMYWVTSSKNSVVFFIVSRWIRYDSYVIIFYLGINNIFFFIINWLKQKAFLDETGMRAWYLFRMNNLVQIILVILANLLNSVLLMTNFIGYMKYVNAFCKNLPIC